MKRGHEGFTMVELLVVMVVVATLAAMMMPVMQSARERARRMHCASNERQLAAAVSSYTTDWDGVLPRWWTQDGGPPNSTLGLQHGQRDWAVDTLPYVANERLYMCPGKNLLRGYGLNLWLALHEGFPVYAIDFPSRTLLFSEIKGKVPQKTVFDFTDRSAPEGWSPVGEPHDHRFRFDPRHDNGANVAFVDGHVKWIPSSEHTRWVARHRLFMELSPVSISAGGTPVGTYWWPTATSPPGS